MIQIGRVSAFLLLTLFAAIPLSANIVQVDCSGATPGAFPTITAALASLPSKDGHTVRITGTCVERVQVFDWTNLRLEGNPSATLLHDGNTSDFHVLWILDSENVTLRDLTIGAAPNPSVPYTPLQIGHSTVHIQSCTLQGGTALASGALWVVDRSRVELESSTIQNSSPSGIRLDSGEMNLGDSDTGGPNVIQANSAGIRLRAGSNITIWGNNIIRDNGSGIISNGGHVFLCCTPGLLIADNASTGISITLGGDVQANSPVTFENNGFAGVRLLSGSAVLTTGQIFRGNGQSGNSGSAAIIATGNAHLELFNAEITDNAAHGVLLEDNASARIFNNVIRDNAGNGIRVIALSSARLFAPNSVSGNDIDLFCAPNSFARGDDAGVGKKFCPGFDKSGGPGPD
ncbi:MAG: right-handed parallel beta-helix repeat-containing protein [Thermoanaerobaculia bacterium]